ncbi:MAG: hypothetical protein AAGF12_01095 [Myxococcota bacterium]
MIEPKLRGAILLDQIHQIERLYGPAVIERALARLDLQEREAIEGAVTVSWLSVHTAQVFKVHVAEELDMDPLDLQRQIVRLAIGETIHNFWRVLLRQLWDSAIVRRTPILYSKTFDRGELRMEDIGKGRATFVLTGWPTMPEYDLIGLAVGIETLLEFSGRHDARLTWRREPPTIVLNAVWR